MADSKPTRRPYSRQDHPKYSGIYAIVHIKSGRHYIGSSRNIYHRWRIHKSELRRGVSNSRYLQNAWNKYGEAAFHFKVIEACLKDPIMLVAREQYWIDKYKNKLLNMRKHADAAFGVPRTSEQRKHMSHVMTGNKNGKGSHFHGLLTEDDVKTIIICYASGEETKLIAADFKVNVATITRIAGRKTWWNVEVSPEIEAACKVRLRQGIRGKDHPKAKLYDHVDEIRERLRNGEKSSTIAKDFNVTPGAINQIKRGGSYNY